MAQLIRSGRDLDAVTQGAVDAKTQRRRETAAAKLVPVSGESAGKVAHGSL